jgi:hypothetical protein
VPGCPFIGSEGERGGHTGRGIRWSVVGCRYGPSGSVGRGNGGVSGESRGGSAVSFLGEGGHWGGVCAGGSGNSCVQLASSRGRRKPSGAHVAERGEGRGGLGRPEAMAQWGGRPAAGSRRKEVAQEKRRGERADQRPRPRRLGRKPEMGPSSKRNSF